MLRNGSTVIGLFKGMFERTTLTFNPGWDQDANELPDFTDVRELQKQVTAAGLVPNPMADESTSGPGFFVLEDPDGNPVLVDQHV